MPRNSQKDQWARADDTVRRKLPPGVKLVRTLRGHTGVIGRIAWSRDGQTVASPSNDGTIRLWDPETVICKHTLSGHKKMPWSVTFDFGGEKLASAGTDGIVMLWSTKDGQWLRNIGMHPRGAWAVAFDPSSGILFSGGNDAKVKAWDPSNGKLLFELLGGHEGSVNCLAFDSKNRRLASGSLDMTIGLWDVNNKALLHSLQGHQSSVLTVAVASAKHMLASGNQDTTFRLWDIASGKLVREIEAHTRMLQSVDFSASGDLLASKAADGSLRLWDTDTGRCLATISEDTSSAQYNWGPGIAFHPTRLQFATVGSDPTARELDCDSIIHIYELDADVLFGQAVEPAVTYTSAKVVLVGDSGVGKTGLGWRLAHGEFREHSSTHGQQFWLLNQLCKQRSDGTQCEAVLWDLAGQPDYRIIHALFLDDADLALVVFDPTRDDDPLGGIEFWLKQLKIGTSGAEAIPAVLIAARSDRGAPRLTREELESFCERRGIKAYLSTSAKAGEGIEELIQQMRKLIVWDDKPATVTNGTFKRIKDYVLGLKETGRLHEVILTPEELSERLQNMDQSWKFCSDDMLTVVGHLTNHGYVTKLTTSDGEPRILLAPELLNNLAASLVLAARKNEKGLGLLEENRLFSGGYPFAEQLRGTGVSGTPLESLNATERDILLDSVVLLLLRHNICFREIDPLNGRTYLVFPDLINLKRPIESDGTPVEDGVAYTVSGSVENVYASLVVLMGYTQTFTCANQWHNHARYEVGNGQVCGFRLEAERDGEVDFILYFGADTVAPVRMLFQGLFENFLARPNVMVRRLESVSCSKGHLLHRAVVRERIASGAESAYCSKCGEKIPLSMIDQPIQLTKVQAEAVETDRQVAHHRSRFEQVLFCLKTYTADKKLVAPTCFISYAWGNPAQERWVEKSLATDLQKAGLTVVLDRWENARIGSSVPRFIERVAQSDRIIVVGTPLYRRKYDNAEPMRSFVVAAEGDLIGKRMIGSETQKESVLPVLLEGTEESAFPYLLHGRIYADFRLEEGYFDTALILLLSLYRIEPTQPVVMELRGLLSDWPT